LIRKYSIRISAAIALLVALIFYSLNLRHKENANVFERTVLTVSTPVVAVVSRVDGFFSSIWENYIYLVNVEKENRQLKEALKVLKTRLIENREAVLDNERLKNSWI
jgi:rod shape-determining protein MreC